MMLALALLAATATNAPVPKPPCRAQPSRIGAASGARVRPLGSEPPAWAIYAVLRTENGCTRPVPVNERRLGNR